MTQADATHGDVLSLVTRWATAELHGDVAAYDELLDPGFVGIGPVGFVLTKQQWAARHRGDLTNHEFEVLDPHIRLYGDTAIVVAVQQQRTTAKGRDTSGSFRIAIVAVRRGDRWTIANVQLSGPIIGLGEAPPFAR